MPATTVDSAQIRDGTVQRSDLNTSLVGQSVVAKIVQGSNIALSSTGADSGTGDVTVSATQAVSSDAGNIATLGSDSLILVPQSTLWSMRLRSYNAIAQNPNFEIDQSNVGNAVVVSGNVRAVDRWIARKPVSTLAVSTQQGGPGNSYLVPGTNFAISQSLLRSSLSTQQASLAAGDGFQINHNIEGPNLRELISDVFSLQVLVRSNVAPLKFGLALRDGASTRSLTLLATIPTANVVTLLQFPNLPIWPAGGTFTLTPGNIAAILTVCLATGSTNMSPSNSVWNTGNFWGAVGQDNFGSFAVGTYVDLIFAQLEPGPVCTTLIDKSWSQNYQECLRYNYKTYDLATAIGTVSTNGVKSFISPSATTVAFGPFQFPVPMAKAPTVTVYNHMTGAANSVRDGVGTDHGSAAASTPSQNGFVYLSFTTAVSAAQQVYAHFTADTGW